MQGFSVPGRIISETGNDSVPAGTDRKREWRKQVMKKFFTGILTAAIILSVGATGVLAAGRGNGRNYKDQNRDRVCDYAVTSCYNQREDCGDQTYCSRECIHDGVFTDEDNDGICDHHEERMSAADRTQGGHHGRGCRR